MNGNAPSILYVVAERSYLRYVLTRRESRRFVLGSARGDSHVTHVLALWLAAAQAASVAAAQGARLPVALVIAYADGRVVSTILGDRPYRSWTPIFPRAASAPKDAGSLAVNAIEYFAEREQDGVRVEVWLRFGTPHQRRELVSRVLVAPGAPVEVQELRAFGVEPVRLELAPVGPLALSPPLVESHVPSLDVWLDDIITDAPPRYKLMVRNRSWRPVRWFAVETFREKKRATIGRQGDVRSVPIVEPAGTYTFYVPISSVPAGGDVPVTPTPLESIVISSALFDDLSVEGDAALAARQLLIEAGRAEQLRRVFDLWESVVSSEPGPVLSALRKGIAGLPIAPEPAALEHATRLARELVPYQEIEPILQAGMQNVKDLVLDDLRHLDNASFGDASELRSELQSLRASYSDWLTRLITEK